MTLPYNVRDFDGMDPSIAHPDSKNTARDLTAHLNDVRGKTTIGIGAASVVVDVDPALHGQPLQATLNGVVATGVGDATATTLLNAAWHATTLGRFTLTVNANATAVIGLSYWVAGKSVG